MKKIYFIWIGWIWTSGLARYYKSLWYEVYGSDASDSEIMKSLEQDGIDCIIWEDDTRIDSSFEKVIYSSAIPNSQSELQKAKDLWVQTLTYPEWLWEITSKTQLISIAGTHGKSTTTSLISLILKASDKNFSAIVGSILKEFDNSNFYFRNKNDDKNFFFALESCEYKRNFLNYKPYIAIITNIEVDHLDYFKDENDYKSAFEEFINNIVPWGYVVINGEDTNCKEIIWKRKDISYISVYNNGYTVNNERFPFPKLTLKVPWDHILFDARLAYTTWKIIGVDESTIISALEEYNGIWRRMEVVWETKNKNILMSDYGHHPTEIIATTKALKEKYPEKKLYTIFQPHQYSRTIELLEDFKNCFDYCDTLIIPNIYESRDSEEDKTKMNGEVFINALNHKNKYFWNGFENTLKLIEEYDNTNTNSSIILILWAGNIDDLRYKIKTS